MSETQDIPQLVRELADLSKAYVRDNTVEPMKRLGRLAGFSILGATMLTIGWVLLSVAGLRLFLSIFPDTQLWSTLAYVAAALAALFLAALLAWRASSSNPRL